MKKEFVKREKGITLIALVVTIIVLLILAGVSINLVLGEKGIIQRAKRAQLDYEISSDLETLNIEYSEYLIEKQNGNINITFLEYLEEKSYIVDYDDELKQMGRVTLNGKVYSVDTSEKVQIEYLSEANGTASLMPRITKMETTVTSNTAKIDIQLVNAEGITLKYIIQKEGQTEIIEETQEIEDLTYTFNNLEKSTTYIVTVEVTNEYGTTKRKATIKTISLSELTNGKASFEIEPNTKWQKEVTAKIVSSYSEENTILQYKIGTEGEWTPYTAEFTVSENGTLYGRYYDSTTEEIGYTFTLGVDVVDDIKPEIKITDEQINAKTIRVTVNSNDNETGMPETIEYKYYIGTDGENYTLKETLNTNIYLYEELNASTQYYIKVTATDNAENEGEVVKTITTATPILVSKITLDKTEATIGNTNTLQLTATVEPDNAEDKTLKWSSSNTSIATVSDTGLVTPVSTGTVTITCKSNDGGATANCSVTIVNGSLIYTREDLEAIVLDMAGSYTLMNDIDAENWSTITGKYQEYFKGTLDGNGYSIKNLNNPLFHTIQNATIKNIKFENVSINMQGEYRVGTISRYSYNKNTIANVGVVGDKISGKGCTGGLIGEAALMNSSTNKLSVKDCYVRINLENTSEYDSAGIACTSNYVAYLDNCYYIGNITATKRSGPIVNTSENNNSKIYADVTNCYYKSELLTNLTIPEGAGTGLTTAQFTDSSNFEGWDFENTWVMKNGVPELRIFVKE